ncbi:unnamed protein product [Euphydryas editha]|uniref:Uncharacterized protein n=1 Tax=Euphydryas editha TaxID=104508 RepID=A0AAU9UGS0_EUPED|nr:unnamed protein product [Euphydryas editha]
MSRGKKWSSVKMFGGRAGGGRRGAGRHVGGSLFVNVPAEMTGRWTLRPRPERSNFREQRIDGSGLPLLTEEHLTGMLQMKLGPALKLRAVVARRLEPCAQCVAATATATATAMTVPTLNMPKVNGTSLKSEPRSNTTSPS